jgi:nicotinate phosphoribosyltransferase
MNKTLLTDLYQITMNAAYFDNQRGDETATFDMFIRNLPKDRGYFLAAGLEDVIGYVKDLSFEVEDIQYLREQGLFKEEFLEYLKDFKFTGDIYAVLEGTVVFPNEPILRITAPRMEAQFIESFVLNVVNYQTMIATKASRVVEAAKGKAVIDFGLHSFIMSFDQEIDAFRAYVETFPDNATLLIDTYDVMQGAKNAAEVAKELEDQGHKLFAVRLDSGDLAGDSIKIRKYFDSIDLDYLKIVASNDLNEYKIEDMIARGAQIDVYGVGTEMITSKDCPAVSGVYKISESEENGRLEAKIKLSEGKKTLPGRKQVYRVSDEQGNYVKDIIALEGEEIQGDTLLVPVVKNGEVVYDLLKLQDIQQRAREQLARLPSQCKRIRGPDGYKIELSKGLTETIDVLTEKYSQKQAVEVGK